MEIEIKVYKYKDMDLEGATIIEGFPTVGLVSSIAANYLIGALALDQITALDSHAFPPVSMVYASKPKFPARIYADAQWKVAVFLSEFTPSPQLARPLAHTILMWAKENKCSMIVTSEGLPVGHKKGEIHVYAVGSTPHARELCKKNGIPQLETGIITGVTGVLLNEGRIRGFDIISLLVEVVPDMPDARAAAKIVEAIDRLLPQISIDVTPLYREAETIEGRIRVLRDQAKPATIPLQMYG
jgi:uncharacterized protein